MIGKEGQQILVKHSSSYIRVHPCRLQPLLHQSPSNQGGSVLPDTTAQSPLDTCDKVPPDKPINSAMNLEPDSDDETNNEESEPITTDTENLAVTSSNSQVEKPRIKQHVKIRESDDTEWEPVNSRGGKATGKYSNWYNVQNLDNSSLKCVNWDTLKEWKPMPDTNEILFSKNEQYDQSELLQAKLYELDKWKENNVYTEVKYENQSYISQRWVNTCKYVDGCKKIKARLVARGFGEANSTVLTDSPTCSKESLRLIFTICASKPWKIHSLDISTAFLQGKSIDREVYVLPPAEANVDKSCLWKLKVCVYGLGDASRQWYLTVADTLKALGMKPCKTDPALFKFFYNDELKGLISTHVDDFFYCGETKFFTQVIKSLKQSFTIKSSQGTNLVFLLLHFTI